MILKSRLKGEGSHFPDLELNTVVLKKCYDCIGQYPWHKHAFFAWGITLGILGWACGAVS